MSKLLYVVGQSNTGKTTSLNNALCEPTGTFNWPITHMQYPGGIQLGIVRDEFSGTDALGKHVQISVPNWLCGPYRPPLVVGEGMRFTTKKFMQMLHEAGWRIEILRLTASEEVLEERRAHRTEKQLEWLQKHKTATVHRDHEQTPEWLASNKSQVNKLYDFAEKKLHIPCSTLDTTEGFGGVSRWLMYHPVIQQMLREPDLTLVPPGHVIPGSDFFKLWHGATMHGRELLKKGGVGRWQWEPAMAFLSPNVEPPEAALQGEGTYVTFFFGDLVWWIYAEPKRETAYGRAKRVREEKAAREAEETTTDMPDISGGPTHQA